MDPAHLSLAMRFRWRSKVRFPKSACSMRHLSLKRSLRRRTSSKRHLSGSSLHRRLRRMPFGPRGLRRHTSCSAIFTEFPDLHLRQDTTHRPLHQATLPHLALALRHNHAAMGYRPSPPEQVTLARGAMGQTPTHVDSLPLREGGAHDRDTPGECNHQHSGGTSQHLRSSFLDDPAASQLEHDAGTSGAVPCVLPQSEEPSLLMRLLRAEKNARELEDQRDRLLEAIERVTKLAQPLYTPMSQV
jgi:hypothetical protein